MTEFINYLDKNIDLKYSGSDKEKLFKRNRKQLGENWIYYNKKIVYRHNEQGFRNDSFDSVDWSQSIVVLGCSNIQGIGLAEEDTLVKQLEYILNKPVVNLGIGAAGIDLCCWNSTILHNHYPRPKAIVQVWTHLERYAVFEKNGRCVSYLPHDPKYNFWLNWDKRSEFYIETDRALWKDKTIYCEGSFYDNTVSIMNVKKLPYHDTARDLGHPGIESNRIAAEIIAENLIKQGL